MSTASDNTAKWAVRKFGGAGLPVGFEYFTTNPNIPAGSLPLLGGVYSRTLYKDLWDWVQEQTGYLIEESEWQEKSAANNGNVPFYSKGDGTTTFRVPSLKCWVKGANGIEEVGSYLSAGLPILPDMSHTHTKGTMNITGGITYITAEASDISNSGYPTTGAFNWQNEAFGQRAALTSGAGSRDLYFDASRSWTGETSSASLTRTTDIYGNSDTVQPKSIVGMWLVKAYGTVTNVGSTDVSAIAQGLTEAENRISAIAQGLTEAENRISAIEDNKVDKEGNAWVVEFYRNGTEWYRVWSDGWVEQGGKCQANATKTYLKPFANTNYTGFVGSYNTTNYSYSFAINNRTATSGKMAYHDGGYTGQVNWYACGMGA